MKSGGGVANERGEKKTYTSMTELPGPKDYLRVWSAQRRNEAEKGRSPVPETMKKKKGGVHGEGKGIDLV